MIIKKIILIFFVLGVQLAFSQEINIGLKGGANYNIIGKLYHLGTANGGGIGLTPTEDYYYKADSQIGLTFGVFGKVNFDKFYIQGEINYAKLNNSYPLALQTTKWEATTLDIPLLVGYRLLYPVAVYAGPNFRVNNDITLEGVQNPILYEKSVLGISAGFHVELDIATVDLRYTFGATKEKLQRIDIDRANYGTNVAYLFSYHPNQIILTVNVPLISFNKSGSKWKNNRNGQKCMN